MKEEKEISDNEKVHYRNQILFALTQLVASDNFFNESVTSFKKNKGLNLYLFLNKDNYIVYGTATMSKEQRDMLQKDGAVNEN